MNVELAALKMIGATLFGYGVIHILHLSVKDDEARALDEAAEVKRLEELQAIADAQADASAAKLHKKALRKAKAELDDLQTPNADNFVGRSLNKGEHDAKSS